MQRKTIVDTAANLSPCIVAMEACCGAHHLARLLTAQGHTLRLMSPEYVRPYVKAQKNDDRDAEAIAEAATRPTMRFVTIKSETQLDMQTLHRARERLVIERTSLMNQLRAVLLERGVIVPKGCAKLRLRIAELHCVQLSPRIRLLVEDVLARWQTLDSGIASYDAEFKAEAKNCTPIECPKCENVEHSNIAMLWRRIRQRPGTDELAQSRALLHPGEIEA